MRSGIARAAATAAALLGWIAGPSAPAGADGGVLEINHTCAVQTGCFPEDTPGYPVTIGWFLIPPGAGPRPRSYRLTSDLVVPDANTTAILVRTPDVTIDLAGFRIVRAGCEWGSSCARVAGSGSGVAVSGAAIRGVTVRDGTIVGMGASGVSLGADADVRRVRAIGNGWIGISVGTGSIVAGCHASSNGWGGVRAEARSVLERNVTNSNDGYGIRAREASLVRANVANDNDDAGIDVDGPSASVLGNVVSRNGTGIHIHWAVDFPGGNVDGNMVQYNGIGLSLGAATYRDNTLVNNSVSMSGIAFDGGGNVCDGGSCPCNGPCP